MGPPFFSKRPGKILVLLCRTVYIRSAFQRYMSKVYITLFTLAFIGACMTFLGPIIDTIGIFVVFGSSTTGVVYAAKSQCKETEVQEPV